MVHLFLRLASLLIVLLSFTLVVVRVIPYDDNQLHAFLTLAENCDGQCLMNIHPGTTTLSEAMEQLQSNTWVEKTDLSASGAGYGQIRWQWSGQQPALIDASHPGRVTFYWDEEEQNGPTLDDTLIQTISIYTFIRMYSLQEWFGKPDSGTATIRPDGGLGYSAAYHAGGSTIVLSAVMPCPTNLMSYWNAWTRLSINVGRGTSTYVLPVEMVKLC